MTFYHSTLKKPVLLPLHLVGKGLHEEGNVTSGRFILPVHLHAPAKRDNVTVDPGSNQRNFVAGADNVDEPTKEDNSLEMRPTPETLRHLKENLQKHLLKLKRKQKRPVTI